jgi:hypothetical protein
LIAAGYKILIIYIKDDPEHISAKIRARQEYGMPYGKYPFYRFVPSGLDAVNKQITSLETSIGKIKDKIASGAYNKDLIHIETVQSRFDPSKLPEAVDMTFFEEIENIMRAYDIEEFTPSPAIVSDTEVSRDTGAAAAAAAAASSRRSRTRRGGAHRRRRFTRRRHF